MMPTASEEEIRGAVHSIIFGYFGESFGTHVCGLGKTRPTMIKDLLSEQLVRLVQAAVAEEELPKAPVKAPRRKK